MSIQTIQLSPKARSKLNSSQKNGHEPEENLKSTSPQWIKNLNPDTVEWHWSGDALFWSFQLTIAWMSNIKLKTNCICLGLQASKCDTVSRMWHSKRGGGRTDRFSHILLPRRRKCFARQRVPLKFVLCLLPRNTFVIIAPFH